MAIIPPEGHPNEKKYSIKTGRWIRGMARNNHIKVRHTFNCGEKKLSGNYVEGYDSEIKKVHEAH